MIALSKIKANYKCVCVHEYSLCAIKGLKLKEKKKK